MVKVVLFTYFVFHISFLHLQGEMKSYNIRKILRM